MNVHVHKAGGYHQARGVDGLDTGNTFDLGCNFLDFSLIDQDIDSAVGFCCRID